MDFITGEMMEAFVELCSADFTSFLVVLVEGKKEVSYLSGGDARI